MTEIAKTDAAAIIEAAQTAVEPVEVDPNKVYSVVAPAGATVHLLDLSRWADAPARKTGTYRPQTVQAFIDYAKAHVTDATTVWVHPTNGQIGAVIDDHAGEGPDWREHLVTLALGTTPEWDYWLAKDGAMMSQAEFAEHIEGGLNEIQEPAAADVLEIAQSFHASVGSTFRSSIRLTSGEQKLQYDEEVSASAGTAGELTVPTEIVIAVAPFIGEDAYRVKAWLRFRLRAGQLTIGYKLDRPESHQRDALQKIAERLAEQFPQTYVGQPPV